MTTFKVLMEYDGTRYSGWQEQKNARTVMGEIRKAAVGMLGSEVELQGPAGPTPESTLSVRCSTSGWRQP